MHNYTYTYVCKVFFLTVCVSPSAWYAFVCCKHDKTTRYMRRGQIWKRKCQQSPLATQAKLWQ